MTTTLRDVRAALVRIPLPVPFRFGDYVIAHRDYALVQARSEAGATGLAFGLTRAGPVCELVNDTIAPLYDATTIDPPGMFERALLRAPAALRAGTGYRALSIVDLAVWDLVARAENQPMVDHLAPTLRDERLPVVALVGYPPTSTPDEVLEDARGWYARGCRSFKTAICSTVDETRARLDALGTLPGVELMLDGVWSFRDAAGAAGYVRALDGVKLAWFEDPFPPGAIHEYVELSQLVDVPLCAEDDAGGAYYPEALTTTGAFSFLRVDATCMGGASRFASLCAEGHRASLTATAHIFPAFHAPLLVAAGGGLVEWGRVGSGLDPLSDMLPALEIEDGQVTAQRELPGFGISLDADRVRAHVVSDPHGIAHRLDG